MAQTPPSADRLFNNADSFAQVFDEAWKRLGNGRAQGSEGGQQEGSPAPDPAEGPVDAQVAGAAPGKDRLQRVLDQLADHPFAQANPQLARQVGEFRIRLLGL